ncbi:unnamed protein product [Hanseniaspora opuntiae]
MFKNLYTKQAFRHFSFTFKRGNESQGKYSKVAQKIRVGIFQRVRQISSKYRNFIVFSAMLQIVAMIAQDNKDLNHRYTLLMRKYDDIMEEANKYGPTFWNTFDFDKEMLPLNHLFEEQEERKNIFRWYFKINDFIQKSKEKNRQAEEYKKQLMEQKVDDSSKLEKQNAMYEEENAKLWKEFLEDMNSDVTKKKEQSTYDEDQLTKSELKSGERLPKEIKQLMAKEKELKTYFYDAPIVRVDNGESGNYAKAPDSVESEIKTFV